MRKRKIIKRGENSYAIALLSADIKDFKLSEGKEVYIDDINVIEDEGKKK